MAIGRDVRLLGVMGLRDSSGGLAARDLKAPGGSFRPAPKTGDLVIDGLAVAVPRAGIGGTLVAEALRLVARRASGPRSAIATPARWPLHDSLRFAEGGRGGYGLPWWGQVHALRRDAA